MHMLKEGSFVVGARSLVAKQLDSQFDDHLNTFGL